MYSDNETDVDLLGFEDEVHNIVDLVTDPTVLPVTAGILADWGAGKSSLLKMVAKELRSRDVVVVEFSPWRIETYDDAKTAFLSAVVEQVADHLPDEPETPLARRAAETLSMLRRRVKWMRVAGLAAKHIVTLSAPTLDELDGLLKDDKDAGNQPSSESVSRDFRSEFEELVAGLEGQLVVVLVDDLDRSMPEQVPEILQAIRLFLSVSGTAFVLATDERVVRDAIRIRYPHAALASETNLPSEYLEKIVQVPVRIPPVGPAEAESYLNLLVAQRHLSEEHMVACLAKAKEIRASGSVSVSMNLGLAREAVGGDVGDAAEREFALMGRVSRLLAVGLKGNPRQLKRYLNAMEMRWSTALRRRLDLDRGVVAKLMVLEYAEPARYKELHRWVTEAPEASKVLGGLEAKSRRMLGITELALDHDSGVTSSTPTAEAESTSRGDDDGAVAARKSGQRTPERLHSVPRGDTATTGEKDSGASRSRSRQPARQEEPAMPAGAARWLESKWEVDWLALDPPLAGIDLGPYFELGRAGLPSVAVRARALPERLQQLLQMMASNDSNVRDTAAEKADALDAAEASLLADAALDRLPSEKLPGNLILSLATVAGNHASLAPGLLLAIRGVPFDGLTVGVPLGFARRLKGAATDTAVDEVLRMWAQQSVNTSVARTAQQELDRRAKQ
ncbi:KAP family P-loop NTPase fold protein [Nocardioides acrostichi]|uniref:KAP NTPase domain-containing protein n=1 Tax=Nocardioides acrostichi TaxID=2784339 RepID=A0A930UWM0_9ACTN|nr:P-loop NTPase fold protein [Nocardioides acrostichi]MBF4161022.1 hypothetical protein [Nocardioides acrostichi]